MFKFDFHLLLFAIKAKFIWYFQIKIPVLEDKG